MTGILVSPAAPAAAEPVPARGAWIEVEIDGVIVAGEVATRRRLGAGLWQLVLATDSGLRVVPIMAADDGGWCGLGAQEIGLALGFARRIDRGETLHGPVNVPLREMARALLILAGEAG